jgi:hypothetical protein
VLNVLIGVRVSIFEDRHRQDDHLGDDTPAGSVKTRE